MATPHRVVGSILEGLVDGVRKVGNTISGALDAPPAQIGIEGPHRAVQRLLDGGINSIQALGEGISRALDHPVEQFGVPPELGEREFRLPFIKR